VCRVVARFSADAITAAGSHRPPTAAFLSEHRRDSGWQQSRFHLDVHSDLRNDLVLVILKIVILLSYE